MCVCVRHYLTLLLPSVIFSVCLRFYFTVMTSLLRLGSSPSLPSPPSLPHIIRLITSQEGVRRRGEGEEE